MKKIFLSSLLAAVLLPVFAQAQVTVAVLPFQGEPSARTAQQSFTSSLLRGGQVGVVADSAMKDILAIHEQAQLVGSSLHDISKLKTAEFIITGNIINGVISISAIDVNTSVIVFSKTSAFSQASADSICRNLAAQCRDALLLGISGTHREPPDAAKPYLAVLSSLVNSLSTGDEASYPFLAVYSKGNFIHPNAENKASADKARQFLKYFRPYFIRSSITFISIEKKSGNVLITCIIDKAGSKTKHQVGFVELDDGSLALLDELHKVLL
jgi:hypothetical protein